MSAEKLRLRATDAEDLGVIAACLQDARVALQEMAFIQGEGRFAAAFTRYRRERQDDPSSCAGLTECQAGLLLEGIAEVKYRGLDPAEPGRELSLLTIATRPGKAHAVYIELLFEGEAAIQLRTDAIAARLDDFGEPVPCKVTPCDHFAGGGMEGWTEPYGAQA